MKHNKFKTNKLTTAANQDQSPKPQQEYVFSNLPVSGIHGQTEMKHTKFKTNKMTTAAWTKQSRKRQDFNKTSKKGFLWDGSDGVDHVAREVLQHGVANRGSRRTLVYCTISFIAMQGCRTDTQYTRSLGYNSVCYITSRIGWVSLKGIFSYRL